MESTDTSPCGVALLAAAGSSARLGGSTPKVYLPVAGVPMLRRSAQTLHAVPALRAIVVMAREEDLARAQEVLAGLERVHVVAGGETRQESVLRGLIWAQRALGLSDSELVLVHDAARCLVSRQLVESALSAGAALGAVTAAVPVTDTITTVKTGEAGGRYGERRVERALPRHELQAVQTPQVFRADLLLRAHNQAGSLEEVPSLGIGAGATDDATLVQRIASVFVIPGERDNVKVTYPEDLLRAETMLQSSARP